MSTQAIPATSAASVPGRMGTQSNGWPAIVSVWRGSMEITLNPARSHARSNSHPGAAPPMRVSAGPLPNSTTTSAFSTSPMTEPV